MTQTNPYPILRELSSLDRKRRELDGAFASEQKRLDFLHKQKSSAENELQEAENEIKRYHVLFSELDQKMNEQKRTLQIIEQRSHSAKSAHEISKLEQEMAHLQKSQAELELKGMQSLEDSENCEAIVAEKKNFLLGVEKSIADINADVKIAQSELQGQILGLENQQQSLIIELSPAFQKTLALTKSKFKGQPFLAFAVGERCDACRFFIDRMSMAELHTGKTPFNCPGCARILVPQD